MILCIALPLLAPLARAQETAEPSTYMGRTIAQTMHWTGASWLVRHKRDQEEASLKMREELRLKPGMNVCDMGSGNGYHTLPIAKAIAPTGKAYAVDIQPEMLTMLDELAKKEKVENIVSVLGIQDDPKLPPASCDLILLVDVYHEFSRPEPMLKAMKAALAPGGQLVFIEFRAEDDSVPIKPEHKMSKPQLLKELTANGFQLSRSYDDLPWQHMLWFEAAKPAAPAPQ